MTSFLLDLAQSSDAPRTVIVMDENGIENPRQYEIRPRRLLYLLGGAAGLLALLLLALVLLTPIRRVFLGPDPEVLRETARMNAIRAAALEDSLALQDEFLAQLRTAIIGDEPTTDSAAPAPDAPVPAAAETAPEIATGPPSDDWADHEQPAIPFGRLVADRRAVTSHAVEAYLASLQFPVLVPVEGFWARGFDASRGHYGLDIAVEEGTPIRSIGDGYVVFADWTNDGGYVVAVQHADGYLSAYKHNSRLLKRVGDRVRSREAVALSGNTGEITTGPHLHVELWRNGLAQDPRLYFVGP